MSSLAGLSGRDPSRHRRAEVEEIDVPPSDVAGLIPRAAAMLIDYVVLLIATAVASFVIGRIGRSAGLDGATAAIVSSLVGLAIIAVYFAGLESSTSQGTLGKMAFGIQVTDRSGRPIGFRRALGRTAAKLLSMVPFFLGFLMAVYSDRRRALHDIVAGTLVLKAR